MALLNPLNISQPPVVSNSSNPAPDNADDASLESAPSFGSQLDAAKKQGVSSDQESTDLAQEDASTSTVVEVTDGKILQAGANVSVAQPANIAASSQTAEVSLLDALVADQTDAPVLATLTSILADASTNISASVGDGAVVQTVVQPIASSLTSELIDSANLGAVAEGVATNQAATTSNQIQAMSQVPGQIGGAKAEEDTANPAQTGVVLSGVDNVVAPTSDVKSDGDTIAQLASDAKQDRQDSSQAVNLTVLNPGAAIQVASQVSEQNVQTTDSAPGAVGNTSELVGQITSGTTAQNQAVLQSTTTNTNTNTLASQQVVADVTQAAQPVIAQVVSDNAPLVEQPAAKLGNVAKSTAAANADVIAAAQTVVADTVSKPLPAQSSPIADNVRVLQVESGNQDQAGSLAVQNARNEGPVGLQAVLSESNASVVVQHAQSSVHNAEIVTSSIIPVANGTAMIQSHPSIVSHDGFGSVLTRTSSPVDTNFTQTSYVKLEPHEVSFNSGPVSAEVLRVLKEGGGRVVMEVTPPDQGTVQLDLRLDSKGNAHLVVQGASDSTRARLEQGSQQLFDQFQNMGLNLTMDMRQQSEMRDQAAFTMGQGNAQLPGADQGAMGEDLAAIRQARIPASESAVSIYA